MIADLIYNNYIQPTEFYYFGNDATLLESDFQDPAQINLDACFTWPNVLNENEMTSIALAPNPTSGLTTVLLSGFAAGNIDLEVYNAMGQLMITVVTTDGKKITTRLVKM